MHRRKFQCYAGNKLQFDLRLKTMKKLKISKGHMPN